MNQPFSPQTHIFLWDLHDVILEKSMWNWFLSCMRFKRKTELVTRLNKKTIKIAFIFLCEKLKLTKKQMVSEELIKAAQESNNDALIDLIMQVCTSYSPIKKTVSIMNELTQLGYTHHLGSNIGKTVFDDCTQQFPTIFNLFKEATIPFEYATKVIKKPNPDFFYAHIEKHNLKPEHVIFIDDKLSNVQAAQSIGMHAIHFKNAKQLRKELAKLKIISTLFLILSCVINPLSAMAKETSSSKLTSQSIRGECAVLNATMCNDQQAVIYWLAKGANVNTSNASNGYTPLHFAAGHGNTNIGKTLLDNKALINAQDREGDTPLHIAVEQEHIPFVELLLAHGADQTIWNAEGRTPMKLLLKNMCTYDQNQRKRLSKIHGKLLNNHLNKSLRFY